MKKILLPSLIILAFFLIVNYASAPGTSGYCGDQVCEHSYTTLAAGTSFSFKLYGMEHEIKLMGFPQNNTAIIVLDEISKEVEEGKWYTIVGVPVKLDYITTVYTGSSQHTSAAMIFGEFYESCPDDCGEGMCDDSDSGKDYYAFGVVRWETGTSLDICMDNFTLKEYYCYKGVKHELYECENGCENGACLSECSSFTDSWDCVSATGCYYDEKTSKCYNYKLSCIDEIDTEDDIYVKGTAWGYRSHVQNGKNRHAAYDYCSGNYLYQVYCSSNDEIGYSSLNCPNGCEDGACLEEGTKPDLTVSSISIGPEPGEGVPGDITPNVGDVWRYYVQIKNIGNVAVSTEFRTQTSIDPPQIQGINGKKPGDDPDFYYATYTGANFPIPSLEPGEEYEYIDYLTFKTSGNVDIKVETDAGGDVDESNEYNNDLSYAFYVYPEETTCIDSDGGLNYYVNGIIHIKGEYADEDNCILFGGDFLAGVDECTGSTCGVAEHYCDSSADLGYDFEKHHCPYGCRDGACIRGVECRDESYTCTIEEIPCCEGLKEVPLAEEGDGGCIAADCGSICRPCGNGICDENENRCNCPEDCERPRCPHRIDMFFNKYGYYPGDYFEVTVRIYDYSGNLMPNQVFNIYNVREVQTSTFYTDSAGIYQSTSTVPSDPKYNGEWTFIASVSEGCPYISDEETIYIEISTKCGDGFCSEDEKELICETVCTSYESQENIAYPTTASGAAGAMTATAVSNVAVTSTTAQKLSPSTPICTTYCHVKCPDDCTPNCGNGVCDIAVCEAEGCPIPENEKNCPQDCKPTNYCGSRSSDPTCICQSGYRKERFEAPCSDVPQPPIEIQADTGAAATGMVTGTAGITTKGYRNAYWQCYDGEESYEGGPTSCKSSETWEEYAKDFCEGHCNDYGKCGVNSFRVWNECDTGSECGDSDGGLNYYEKGTATDKNGESYTDFCGQGGVYEYYCDPSNSGYVTTKWFECPNRCEDGACVRAEHCLNGVKDAGEEGVDCGGEDCPPCEKCAKEGEYTSGPVSPEYQYGCCEGLGGFDTHPGIVGRGLLCYYPGKGIPVCKHEGTRSEGWYYSRTGELLRYEDCSRERMCTYYRCVPAHKYLYLYTDKYSYDLNEPVEIYTNTFETGDLELREIKVSVKNPYGTSEVVALTAVCETGGGCSECVPGHYCEPCKSHTVCKYTGTFTGTDTVGLYEVGGVSGREDMIIHTTSFRVYDYSLLGRYLILRNIDGYIYRDAQLNPGPENVMGYMATYGKDGRDYAVIVADFETREHLENFLSTTLEQFSPSEKKIDEYYVYVFETYGQKVYIWTYKTFLIGVMEHMPIAVSTGGGYGVAEPVPVAVPVREAVSEAIAIKEKEVMGTSEKAPDFLTGMVMTGMPVAETTPVYCGMDSLRPQCICRGDETKEEFGPPCREGVCETHYRCKPPYPRELLIAYLDRYPSDIKTTGTECEQEGGYCIGIESSCRPGFEEVRFACKTNSEKCCVREVDRDDFLEMVMKLEGIRVKMDKLERQAKALSGYYDSVGDEERANKFREVAGMFANAKGMIDDIIEKIRANLDNLEGIRSEVKEDIYELRMYISSILEKMVS